MLVKRNENLMVQLTVQQIAIKCKEQTESMYRLVRNCEKIESGAEPHHVWPSSKRMIAFVDRCVRSDGYPVKTLKERMAPMRQRLH